MDKGFKSETNYEKSSSPLLKNSYKIEFKIAGILLLILTAICSLFIKCPSNFQIFIIYTIVGVSSAMILAKSAKQTSAKFKIDNIAIVLGGGVAIQFILYYFNPIGQFKRDDCDFKFNTTNTTVSVRGINGKQDMVLRKKGFVMMDLRGEKKKASINENGQAFFQNLHIGDSVRLNIEYSEPYQTLYIDSVYIIQENGNIDFPVALQGIDKMNGMVLYNDAPLIGVTVKLMGKTGYLLDTTNKTGDFSFSIPKELQKSEYQIWFMKKGYIAKSAPAFPQTGEPLNIVMEKK